MAVKLWRWLEGLGIAILGWLGLGAETARQLIRFVLVGLVAAVVYVAIMALVIDGFGGPVLLGAFLAFVVGTAVSFLGNALWSFCAGRRQKAMWFRHQHHRPLPQHAIAWLLGGAGCISLIRSPCPIVVPIFNFAGHRLITFARPG